MERVEARDNELTISVNNGGEVVSMVALALNSSRIAVREITLRTPTLDDVFLQVTGGRMQSEEIPTEAVA